MSSFIQITMLCAPPTMVLTTLTAEPLQMERSMTNDARYPILAEGNVDNNVAIAHAAIAVPPAQRRALFSFRFRFAR